VGEEGGKEGGEKREEALFLPHSISPLSLPLSLLSSHSPTLSLLSHSLLSFSHTLSEEEGMRGEWRREGVRVEE
jgi:hypothetical protein